jgi:hypothetical protein
MSDWTTRGFGPRARAALVVALAGALGGVLMLWAWNTVAAELFGAPEIRFKHALALQAGVAGLAALPLALFRKLGRRGTGRGA